MNSLELLLFPYQKQENCIKKAKCKLEQRTPDVTLVMTTNSLDMNSDV